MEISGMDHRAAKENKKELTIFLTMYTGILYIDIVERVTVISLSAQEFIIEEYKVQEKAYRSIVKSISWRITGTLDTIIVSYFITGEFTHAFAIGGVEVVTKMVLYFFHERVWNKIKIGRVEDNEGIDYNI